MQKIVNKQRAPKDILLNKILEEIGEENGVKVETPKPEQEKKVKRKPKKRSWAKIFFIFLVLLVVMATAFVGYVVYTATKEEPIVHKKENTLPIIPVKEEKKVKPVNDNVVHITVPKIQEEKKEMKPITQVVPLTPEELKKQERKRAKAALLEQMKN